MEVSSVKLKLIMEKGPRKGEALEFNQRCSIRIGRVVRGNTLPIKDPGISSQHLRIEFDSGKWVITDLDSSNGTVVNSSQLNAHSPFNLRDGDEIKIGECTSIRVQFVEIAASQLRRNPRRQAALKALGGDGGGLPRVKVEVGEDYVEVNSVAAGRSGLRRAKDFKRGNEDNGLGLDGEKCGVGLDLNIMGSGVEKGKRRRRGRGQTKKGSVLEDGNVEESREIKENDGNLLITENEKIVELNQGRGRRRLKKPSALENGNVDEPGEVRENDGSPVISGNENDVELKQGRIRGQPKKDSALGDGDIQKSGDVGGNDSGLLIHDNDRNSGLKQGHGMSPKRTRSSKNKVHVVSGQGLENLDAAARKPVMPVSSRRTRSMKMDENCMSSPVLGKVPESSALDNASYEEHGNEGLVEKKKTQARRAVKKNARQQFLNGVQQNVELEDERNQKGMSVREEAVDVQQNENIVDKLNPGAEACKELESVTAKEDKRQMESNTGGGTFEEVVTGVDSREKKCEACDGPDLQKMTLGQWFDYLEVYLPKEICVVTNQIIADMRKRAQEFHEFMLQQHKEKGKQPAV
ncbi:hypothetical protein Ancab_030278 [Ancistrocladus abbreviatus]